MTPTATTTVAAQSKPRRRVLLISPHFPPDFSAATHRVRLLAPHLARYGWDPTVLTVDAGLYEAALDPGLEEMLPASLRVIRCPAWPVSLFRRFGIGDLGLRSFWPLRRAALRLLKSEHFDAVFITIFPAYTALIGPLLGRRFGVPFVIDYQDPWLNAWGSTVGGGPNGSVDLKSRVSRWLAQTLEPRVVRHASGITAVSSGTYEPILERHPAISPVLAEIPIGTDPADFADRTDGPPAVQYFDPHDGYVHLCYVGTFPPLGFETLTTVFEAARLLKARRPELYGRVRFHFFGTGGQSLVATAPRVLPLAERLGIGDIVTERSERLPYSTVVGIQKQASVLLALGSSEPHYTASRIFPFLLAKRPILAVYHEDSTVVTVLRAVTKPPSVRLLTYADRTPVQTLVEPVFEQLVATVERPVWNAADVNMSGLGDYFAENLAGRLAGVLDAVAAAAS